MPKQTVISNVELLNALRNTKNSTFENRIPKVTQDNIATVMETMDKFTPMYNEMTGEIIQKIGLQIASDFDGFDNPLKIFHKGQMPYGKTIEEIWMDLFPEEPYDQNVSETEVLKRVKPNIKTKYHVENREGFFKSTLSMKELRQAFHSENGIYDYTKSLFTTRLFQSNELNEYLLMKKMLEQGIVEALKVDANVQNIELAYTDDERFSKALAKTLRSTAKQLGFYNTSTIDGVKNVTNVSNQIIVTTPEVEALLDVDVLSSAFHMDKANTDGRLCIIDQFENPDVLAVIVSEDFLKYYDTYKSLEPEVYNPQGLYRNYYYHAHGLASFSTFENVVVITKKDSVDGEVETKATK